VPHCEHDDSLCIAPIHHPIWRDDQFSDVRSLQFRHGAPSIGEFRERRHCIKEAVEPPHRGGWPVARDVRKCLGSPTLGER